MNIDFGIRKSPNNYCLSEDDIVISKVELFYLSQSSRKILDRKIKLPIINKYPLFPGYVLEEFPDNMIYTPKKYKQTIVKLPGVYGFNKFNKRLSISEEGEKVINEIINNLDKDDIISCSGAFNYFIKDNYYLFYWNGDNVILYIGKNKLSSEILDIDKFCKLHSLSTSSFDLLLPRSENEIISIIPFNKEENLNNKMNEIVKTLL